MELLFDYCSKYFMIKRYTEKAIISYNINLQNSKKISRNL